RRPVDGVGAGVARERVVLVRPLDGVVPVAAGDGAVDAVVHPDVVVAKSAGDGDAGKVGGVERPVVQAVQLDPRLTGEQVVVRHDGVIAGRAGDDQHAVDDL